MRFYGKVGYGEQVRRSPEDDVWVDQIVEYPYYGDVTQSSRQLKEGESLNKDLFVSNVISIVADQYASEHFFAIRYVEWAGVRWTVDNVTVQPPRLILRLGGVYNGPTPVPTP